MSQPDLERWKPELIEVDRLQLDVNNPRLAEHGVDGGSQDEVLQKLWDEMAVDEIAFSIAANGFFFHEPLFAEAIKGDKDGNLAVIEGNRRLAAVRLLRDPHLQKRIGATSLPRLSPTQHRALDQLPVIISPRSKLWQYLGFRHVNGAQNWESFAKAQYIAWVHNKLGIPLEKIAGSIGDRHATVLRLYNGMQTLDQAEKAKVFNREDRFKGHFSFSHLYTGLGYSGIQKFLKVEDADLEKEAPVPKSRITELGELCLWLFGSKSQKVAPLVQTQNPDLRELDEAIQTQRGLTAIRSGLPLKVALDISRGDERRFREALIGAKERLQVARGALLTGYAGEADLMETASEIGLLATSIIKEMRDYDANARRTRRRSQ